MKTKTELFRCKRDDLTIHGTLIRPASKEKCPIVIVCHEFMSDRLSVIPYVRFWASRGFAAFCFDFCGGCIVGASEGKTTDMSALTEIKDLLSVIEYANSRPDTDGSRLYLMGCSQGGLVTALTAAKLKDTVKALILFYPALSIPDDARKGHMLKSVFDPRNVPKNFRCGPMKLGRQYVTDVINMDVWQEIAGYTGRVLLVHGLADRLVSPTYSERAFEIYRACGAQVSLKMITGAGHIFKRPDHIEEAKWILDQFSAAE